MLKDTEPITSDNCYMRSALKLRAEGVLGVTLTNRRTGSETVYFIDEITAIVINPLGRFTAIIGTLDPERPTTKIGRQYHLAKFNLSYCYIDPIEEVREAELILRRARRNPQ